MKQRVDLLLVEQGLAASREKAHALVMSGIVFFEGMRVDKPGEQVSVGAKLELRGEQLKYVSRGGLKLEKAIDFFGVSLNNKIAADIGASTGGFTDCMLQNGAAKVYAVDVGYGQLAWSLRSDPRVVTIERTNARYLTSDIIPDSLDFFSVDVSFISLTLILPVLFPLCKEDAEAVCLIKPQFEAGKGKVGKNGVVREAEIHLEVVQSIVNFVGSSGFSVLGITHSPVKGPKGNIEFLVYFSKQPGRTPGIDINSVVAAAHSEL